MNLHSVPKTPSKFLGLAQEKSVVSENAKRFIVRDFTYDENAIAQARREVTELTAVQKEQQVTIFILQEFFGNISLRWKQI